MIQVLAASWALMAGMFLLQVGNGVQGTLVGVRGGIEGFSTFEMSFVMSAYFVGFLGGARLTPEMIRRVGHIRVFAALGSFISAAMVLYPTVTDPIAWTVLRIVIGFCFSGVYVTAESWLNNASSNENRGKSLSLYMIMQMAGLVAGQGVMTLGDPGGYLLFIVPSVLVSISIAPILLTATPTLAFESTKPMSIRRLFQVSPLGAVGILMMGGVFSAIFGMSSVFGTEAGLGVAQISGFIAMIFLGGMFLQAPIGWLSDRIDRRRLVLACAIVGVISALGGAVAANSYSVLLAAAFLIGGMSNPLYALIIAHTNDFLDADDMAAASGGLIFLNGIGAITGPLITGWLMGLTGPAGFFLFIAILMAALAGYTLYRSTQRAAPTTEETGVFAPVLPSTTAVAMEVASEVYFEQQEEQNAT